jgi:hypothetical protein
MHGRHGVKLTQALGSGSVIVTRKPALYPHQ